MSSSFKSQALLLKTTLFLPPSGAQFRTRMSYSFPCTTPSPRPPPPPPSLSFLCRSSLRFPRYPRRKCVGGMRFDGPVVEVGEVLQMEDGDLAVETCITRALPPAVTLEQGIERIREAVEDLKLNPPSTSSGFLRFQVAVPPSAKALNWFCSQPESSAVFPLFFVSKETSDPSYKSLLLNETRGVFGIGSAVYFARDSSSTSVERSQTRRYLSNESTPIVAYGFVDTNFNTESSVMKHQAGSYYFFIPQIELNECEGISMLSATLVWCDFCLSTFGEAIQSFELSLVQATSHFWPTTENCYSRNILSTLRKLNVVEDRNIPMVYMNNLSPGGNYVVDDVKELKEAPSSKQFCVRLSASVVVASNMTKPLSVDVQILSLSTVSWNIQVELVTQYRIVPT
ncbi:hypothetical protein TIFTF001_008132 [Ficus carica]|uniref:Uncharacterized protein n=1 Tax=Ficus carica TaxID=3494 RepID=A0AA88A7Y2_FICCA|nr:hypothetical protein TIFTF001_008132 [Ficus carica]